MNKEKDALGKYGILILVSGFIALIAVVIIFNRPPFYDEDDYLQNVAIIQKFGFTKLYLINLIGSAGPLYSTVHYLLEPITGLQTPNIRLVNVFFVGGVTFLLSCSLQRLQFSAGKYAFTIMAIPMTYVIGGLALTEMPAMFFMTAGIYLMISATNENTKFSSGVMKAMLSGICISLAILGRQPYLLVLAALPIFYYNKKYPKKYFGLFMITLLFSIVLPSYVFFVWNGLVAPHDAGFYDNLAGQGISYRPEFFLLCLAYYAFVFFFIAPGFFILPSKKGTFLLIIAFLFIATLNQKFDLIRFLPLKPIFEELLPPYIEMAALEKLTGSFLVIIGLHFLSVLIRQLHNCAYKKELLFYAVSAVAIAFSCIKLTHGFSSRYAAQAIPFLIPFAGFFYKESKNGNLRLVSGVIIGIMSVLCFYLSF